MKFGYFIFAALVAQGFARNFPRGHKTDNTSATTTSCVATATETITTTVTLAAIQTVISTMTKTVTNVITATTHTVSGSATMPAITTPTASVTHTATTSSSAAPSPTGFTDAHQVYIVLFQGEYNTTEGQTSRNAFFNKLKSWDIYYIVQFNYTEIINGIAIDMSDNYAYLTSRLPGVVSVTLSTPIGAV
ncbi:hypothetical protein BJ085DRAFT_29306 [Dimargaris cristalligena]|uniref:Inhibitor I9 domain-containing protein n=1 Tax=Dimargaris cristalligena TaxID=215637 RepID=A0A4P9ZR40_9FUNG|nr:hypothetical protein BJ085DRAFT_29306 [Dimargaris cristalligena]|eukprot:RKP35618.1 hypothetical protein BJ085DRAFT_29306 [Dimargaris cristalligena]